MCFISTPLPSGCRKKAGGLRNNKRSRPPAAAAATSVAGEGKDKDANSSSSSEDEVAVVKADKRSKKGVNNFSTGGGGVGAEARAAARCGWKRDTGWFFLSPAIVVWIIPGLRGGCARWVAGVERGGVIATRCCGGHRQHLLLRLELVLSWVQRRCRISRGLYPANWSGDDGFRSNHPAAGE